MLSQIDPQTVLDELNIQVELNQQQKQQKDKKQGLKARQRGCKASQIKKHLLPENFKACNKKSEISLSNVIKARNTRISVAAKEMLFGDISEMQESSTPILQLIQLRIITQNNLQTFYLKNKDFKDKIHIKLKQGCIYNINIKFIVHDDIVVGLRLVNNVKRLFVKVQQQQIIGSFAPKKAQQQIELEEKQAPEGFFLRGDYTGKLIIVDSEGNVHCQLSYKLTITKN